MNDQREVVCGGMEVVMHQALGDIQCADVTAFKLTFGYKFMHTDAVKWNIVSISQTSL